MTKGDVAFLLLVVIGVGGLGAIFAFAPQTPVYAPVEITGSTLSVVAPQDYRVDATVSLRKPGFVTIHQSLGGAPGPLVAVSMYLETTAVISSIAVDPALIAGGKYVALLHVDNGDMRFSMDDDLPVTSDGAVVRADFTAPSTDATAE